MRCTVCSLPLPFKYVSSLVQEDPVTKTLPEGVVTDSEGQYVRIHQSLLRCPGCMGSDHKPPPEDDDEPAQGASSSSAECVAPQKVFSAKVVTDQDVRSLLEEGNQPLGKEPLPSLRDPQNPATKQYLASAVMDGQTLVVGKQNQSDPEVAIDLLKILDTLTILNPHMVDNWDTLVREREHSLELMTKSMTQLILRFLVAHPEHQEQVWENASSFEAVGIYVNKIRELIQGNEPLTEENINTTWLVCKQTVLGRLPLSAMTKPLLYLC